MTTPAPAQAKQQHEGNHASHRMSPQGAEAGKGLGAEVMSIQRRAGNSSVNNLINILGGGAPLPMALRGEMEQRFGEEFSTVRVHTDTQAAQSADQFNAKAYTVGNDIAFNEGRFSPNTAEGKRLLAHELAHVVQQRRGGAQPALDSQAVHERSSTQAADAVMANSGPVTVTGGTAVGIACEKDKEEEERKIPPSMTVIMQRPKVLPALEQPVYEINDPKKGKGTHAETHVPFALYSGPDWNILGGGEETSSSRTSLARETEWGMTGGIDFLAENRRTNRLVIGEQKAVDIDSFENATAITRNLEENVARARQQLQQQIDTGKVHPEEVPHLKETIARLEATEKALKNRTDLPEGVVFELTNLSGKGKQIGKGHIDLLAEKYGKYPEFIDHLLKRTFVRDPELAKAMKRDQEGQRGTAADPDIVPALELLTPQAKEELARRLAGKTEKQWEKQKEKEDAEKKADDRAKRDADAKARRALRLAEERKAKADAKRLGDKARKERLKQLKGEKALKGEPKPATQSKRELAESKLKREARDAGKQVQKKLLDDFFVQRKQQDAVVKAKRQAEEKAKEQARKKQRDSELKDQAQRKAQQNDEAQKKAEAIEHKKNEESLQRPEWIDKRNQEARRRNQSQRNEANVTKAAHYANQLAGGIRTVDAFQDTLDKGEGYLAATKQAAKTYLENTNPVFGAIATAKSRQQKDPVTGEQYYGDDVVDAWLGTLGETGAGLAVPGAVWDQAVNAGVNVIAAVDDHMNRRLDPSDPSLRKATIRTATDLAGELTPSRMISSLAGGSARAAYDLGRVAKGDYKGVDKFGEDAVRGKLGSIIQPWGMAGDFVGNLGSYDVGTALEKTVKKTEGTTLTKLGYASGDAMYELGQSQKAKSGEQGMHVQGISMILGATSDVIAGQSLEKALSKQAEAGKGSLADKIGSASADAMYKLGQSEDAKAGNYGPIVQGYAKALGIASDVMAGDSVEKALEKAAEAGKGSLSSKVGSALGDMAFDIIEKSKEILNEDIPAAKKRLKGWWKSL